VLGVDIVMLSVKHLLRLVERPIGHPHWLIKGASPRALRRGCPWMTSGSPVMSLPATTVAEDSPTWGRKDEAPADEPIEAMEVMPTVAIVSGAGARDPSPATASGSSGAVASATATPLGVGAPPIYDTCGLCPAAPLYA
jgi:hypothetical protein